MDQALWPQSDVEIRSACALDVVRVRLKRLLDRPSSTAVLLNDLSTSASVPVIERSVYARIDFGAVATYSSALSMPSISPQMGLKNSFFLILSTRSFCPPSFFTTLAASWEATRISS